VKSHFDTRKKILLIALVFLGPRYVFAQEQENLALGIKSLIYAEQHLLSRDLNETVIMTPKNNSQEEQYKPENGQVFKVKSYWVRKSSLKSFESQFISDSIKQMFYKVENGKEFFLLLVHPESAAFYEKFLQKSKAGPQFWATSTASSRTLLMWQDHAPEKAFFGKLSLNKEIGGVVRTIPMGESARSVGTTDVLTINKKNLPKSFTYMPETLSIIPKDFERGGMIIREIPEDLASGKVKFIPLFSLYANRGDKPPLLAEMIKTSGQSAQDFIRERVIGPFIQQWAELVILSGISMEPHAQNVLIGLDSKGMPNGKFMHRDFGGFNLQMDSFSKLGSLLPAKLPTATDVFTDYHQKFSENSISTGLEVYFDSGFAYNLDQKVAAWSEAGWIQKDSSFSDKKLFSNMIYQELANEFSRLTNGIAQPTLTDFINNNIWPWVHYARENLAKKNMKKPLCSGLFM